MKQAIIDIGSNSMRLTLYELENSSFKILFKEKIMAGLAGYVEDGVLSADGIECAYNGLLDFKHTLESLDIQHTAVFATASLRNIRNTKEALTAIKAATEYEVEVISGEEEARYGYTGAMREVNIADGAFVDIGGASTEIAAFDNGKLVNVMSFHMGALSLYRQCVKKIMPGDHSRRCLQKAIETEIQRCKTFHFDNRSPLVCVGGTARAVLAIAKKRYAMSDDCHCVSASQLEEICALLCRGGKTAADLILKLVPDRIHTIVPGIMILQNIVQRFDAEEIIVSKYGVREGYLCQKLLGASPIHTLIHKTER